MFTNLRALGAEVEAVELGVDRAEATTTGFPDPSARPLRCRSLSRRRFHDAAAAIAAPRGLSVDMGSSEADGVTRFVVERKGEG